MTRRLTHGLAIPDQLHLVEEPGYEFGIDRRAGAESGADDYGPDQCTQGLGSVGSERHQSGDLFRQLSAALRTREKRIYAEKLMGGWQLNAITTLLSGFPFTPQIGSNRSGDGDTRNPDRPNLNPNFTGTRFAANSDAMVQSERIQRARRGHLGKLWDEEFMTGPGLGDVDLSIFKNTKLTERINLQFRAELFNLLNRTNLGSPNAIVFVNNGTAAAPNFGVSPSAGLITTLATTPRQVQFGLKLMF